MTNSQGLAAGRRRGDALMELALSYLCVATFGLLWLALVLVAGRGSRR